MKGSIRLYILFLGTIILSLSTDKSVNGFDLKNKESKKDWSFNFANLLSFQLFV